MRDSTTFSTLEIIFCDFLAENYFVKVLIQLIWAKFVQKTTSHLASHFKGKKKDAIFFYG